MTLVTDRGYCLSTEGKFSVCKAPKFKSKDGCQAACIRLELCLAFNYNKVTQNCNLLTTSKPTNGCPKGYTWIERGKFAKSVGDLEVFRTSDNVCYAKIKADKN